MSHQERLSGAAGTGAVRHFACWSCSLYWLRCTRAGLSPSRSLLVVPLGVIRGGAAGHRMRGLENDVYFVLACWTVIGLSAKTPF